MSEGQNFRLLRDLVLVFPISAKVQTDSGLIVTAVDKTAPQEGIVVAVGEGKEDLKGKPVPVIYKRGDRIIYARQGGHNIKYQDDVLHVIPATEILCRLN